VVFSDSEIETGIYADTVTACYFVTVILLWEKQVHYEVSSDSAGTAGL
jgi:hypothetical protein